MIMEFHRTVISSESENTLRSRITLFFEGAGYTRATLQPAMIIERGSRFGSLVSTSPCDWLARATITLPHPKQKQQTETHQPLTIRLEVTPSIQWVTPAAEAFFQRELDCLESAILHGSLDCPTAQPELQVALRANIMGNLLILLMAAAGVILFLILPFRSLAAGLTGLMLGAFAGQLLAIRWVKGRDPLTLDQGRTPGSPQAGQAGASAPWLQRELRTWGAVFILLGLLHFISNGLLNASWGVALVLVGLASFLITSPGVLVMVSAVLAWSAAVNGLSGWRTFPEQRPVLVILAFFQAFVALQILRRFSALTGPTYANPQAHPSAAPISIASYSIDQAPAVPASTAASPTDLTPAGQGSNAASPAAQDPGSQPALNRSSSAQVAVSPVPAGQVPAFPTAAGQRLVSAKPGGLPLLSAILGMTGLLGYLALLGAIVSGARSSAAHIPNIAFLEAALTDLGLLGAGAGLGSLLSGESSGRKLALLGLAAGALVLLAETLLTFAL
jgi:hypothetical protein